MPIVLIFSDFAATEICALRDENEIEIKLLIFNTFKHFSNKGILLMKTKFA